MTPPACIFVLFLGLKPVWKLSSKLFKRPMVKATLNQSDCPDMANPRYIGGTILAHNGSFPAAICLEVSVVCPIPVIYLIALHKRSTCESIDWRLSRRNTSRHCRCSLAEFPGCNWCRVATLHWKIAESWLQPWTQTLATSPRLWTAMRKFGFQRLQPLAL
jgi:hypothetical protein